MFVLNGKRINIYAQFETEDGTRYANLINPDVRASVGVQEIPDPVPPEDYSDETYYRTEQDTEPYVVFTRKSDEQIAQMMQAKLNAQSLAYLASTDWMAIRAAEGGKAMPQEVKTKRQEARNSIILPADQGA
jgi:hypothetical protein